MKTLLIIDGNNWFRRKAETDIFGKPMRSCYYEIQNAQVDHVLLVWDGFGGLKARRAIYPDYKINRNKPGENIFAFQDEFKKLAQLSRATSIQLDGYEADDVIAAIVKQYKLKYPNIRILVESTDADFTQLDVELLRAKPLKASRDLMVTYKATVGDPSDNIKGIKGFGQKGWDALTDYQKRILRDTIHHTHYVPADIEGFMPKAVMTWMSVEANRKLIRDYISIINFIPILWPTITAAMIEGLNRPDLVEGLLKEYMI